VEAVQSFFSFGGVRVLDSQTIPTCIFYFSVAKPPVPMNGANLMGSQANQAGLNTPSLQLYRSSTFPFAQGQSHKSRIDHASSRMSASSIEPQTPLRGVRHHPTSLEDPNSAIPREEQPYKLHFPDLNLYVPLQVHVLSKSGGFDLDSSGATSKPQGMVVLA
jgi:hypothetical protein